MWAVTFGRELHVKLVNLDSCQTLWPCSYFSLNPKLFPPILWLWHRCTMGFFCIYFGWISQWIHGMQLISSMSQQGCWGYWHHREAADGNSHLGENDAVECIWKLGWNTKSLGRTAAELVEHMSIDAAGNDRSCRMETEKSVCSRNRVEGQV